MSRRSSESGCGPSCRAKSSFAAMRRVPGTMAPDARCWRRRKPTMTATGNTWVKASLLLGLGVCVGFAPAQAQVGGVGAPTAQDSLERNISGLKSPGGGGAVGVSPTGVPSPQQSLDSNISAGRPTFSGRARSTTPRLRYRPPDHVETPVIARPSGRPAGYQDVLGGSSRCPRSATGYCGGPIRHGVSPIIAPRHHRHHRGRVYHRGRSRR
jgi:hypothetical protein